MAKLSGSTLGTTQLGGIAQVTTPIFGETLGSAKKDTITLAEGGRDAIVLGDGEKDTIVLANATID